MTEDFDPTALPVRGASRLFRASPGIAILVSTEILLLGFVAAAAITRSWAEIVIPAFLVLAAMVPALLEIGFRVWFPGWMHGFYVGFLLAGPLAGARLGFYGTWNPWDKVIHASSGLLVGFAVIFAFGVIGRRHLLAFPPYLLTAGILTTGGFIDAAWEIAEYISDHLLGTRAQNASLEDTMTDIICGLAGATAVAIMAGLQRGGRRLLLIDSLLRDRDFDSVAPAMQDKMMPAKPPPVMGGDED